MQVCSVQIVCLGCIVSADGIPTNPKIVQAVYDIPIPTNVKCYLLYLLVYKVHVLIKHTVTKTVLIIIIIMYSIIGITCGVLL